MKFTYLLASLPLLATATPNNYKAPQPQHHCSCLTDAEADAIIKNWANIQSANKGSFKTYNALVNATVAENFISYEETFNNGASDVSFKGRSTFYGIGAGASDTKTQTVKDVKFTTVKTFHDCENIAYRWKYTATLTALTSQDLGGGQSQTQAPAGTKLQYKGIDLVVVDKCTKKITSEYTSQDWLNFLIDLGWEFCPAS